MTNPTPPKLAKFLLSSFTPEPMKESFMGDLEEQFRLVVDSRGYRNACMWYRYQLVVSIIPLFWLRNRMSPNDKFVLVLTAGLALIAGTSPLKGASVLMHLAELLMLLFAAFTAGYANALLFARKNFLMPSVVATTSILLCLLFRGEREEILWLTPFMVLAVLTGLFTCKYAAWRKQAALNNKLKSELRS